MSDAKAILTTLFEIKIVEKNVCGLFIKLKAYFAAIFFLRASNSILSLLDTINASSADEKNPLNTSRKINPKN